MIPLVGIAAGAFVLLALSSRRSSTPRRGSSSGEVLQHTTAGYARGKLSMLRARLEDPTIRAAIDRWAPRFLPGVPREAFVALGASSTGPREQLNRRPGAWGLWGVEPAWLDAHGADDTTRADLGRIVTRATYPTDLEAQVYLGARRYAQALHAARGFADINETAWGPWEYQLAVSMYSAGDGTTSRLLRDAPVAARHEPRGQRWTRVAEDTYPAISRDRSQTLAWALVRPRERYQSAITLARAVGAPLQWYADVDQWEPSADAELSAIAHRR